MSIISGLGNPLTPTPPASNNTNETNDGEAAQSTETSTGTTEANQTETDTTTTSDDGGASDGTTQSFNTAKDLTSAPAEPKAESIVAAQIQAPENLTEDQALAAARQNAEDAQKAYKLQSILDGMTSLSQEAEKIAPVVETAESVEPTTSTEAENVPA